MVTYMDPLVRVLRVCAAQPSSPRVQNAVMRRIVVIVVKVVGRGEGALRQGGNELGASEFKRPTCVSDRRCVITTNYQHTILCIDRNTCQDL